MDPADKPDARLSWREALANATANYRWLRERIVPHEPEDKPTRGRRAWLYIIYTLRRWVHEDRAGGMAAILTIHTLLSTVPIIGLALVYIGRMDKEAGLGQVRDFFRSLVPESDKADEMASEALTLANNISVGQLGTWGFIVAVFIAFALYSTLEQTFNRIWRVTRRRNLLVKFTMFYTLATLGPAVVLYSLAQPYVQGVAGAFGPAITTAIGLVVLNRYMPHSGVRWGPAIVGGLLTAILLELGKIGFGYYATRFALRTYEGMYGPLAILPIVVVWSFLSWLVILLGAEIAVVVQRHRAIALQGYLNRYVRERSESALDSGRTAARLLLAICDSYAGRGEGLTSEALAERFRLSLDRVTEMIGELMRNGFLIETEGEPEAWVPARPPDRLHVIDVLALFEREYARLTRSDALGELFGKIDDERAKIVGELTYADLIAEPRRPAPVLDHRDAAGDDRRGS